MTHANQGKPLEEAVKAAALYYHSHDRQGDRTAKGGGRGCIRKRHPGRARVAGELIYTVKGDVDFAGDADGKAFYAECKETQGAVKLSDLEKREHQMKKLRETAARGCTSGYIFGFMPDWACFWVPWSALQPFLDQPWRRSIDQKMCAAWGLSLPVRVSPGGRPMVLFLDGYTSPNRWDALTAVDAERFAHPLELPLEDPCEWRPKSRKPAVLPPPTTKIEAELRERAGGLDPLHPSALRAFAKKMRGRGR